MDIIKLLFCIEIILLCVPIDLNFTNNNSLISIFHRRLLVRFQLLGSPDTPSNKEVTKGKVKIYIQKMKPS